MGWKENIHKLGEQKGEKSLLSSSYARSKEIYFSIFVLFYRLFKGAWPPQFNAENHNGAAGVSLVQVFLFMGLESWIAIYLGHPIKLKPWMMGGAGVVIYFANCYFLLERRVGIEFEKQFNDFPKITRIALLTIAAEIFILVAWWSFHAGYLYRHLFFPHAGD